MMNFDALPKDKPRQNNVTDGRYTAVVFDAKMTPSKSTPGTEYLNVSFKLDKGGFVNENYFDSDKPFIMYKLGRLLKACDVTLSGTGSLKDVAKVIKGKNVIVDVAVNDRGYGALDYSGDKEGIYGPNEVISATTETSEQTTLDPDITEAIETDILDEDF